MNVELRHLRYFIAVAEDVSFTAAARRVYVPQQVLSMQIRHAGELCRDTGDDLGIGVKRGG